jgi:hypothetical protein
MKLWEIYSLCLILTGAVINLLALWALWQKLEQRGLLKPPPKAGEPLRSVIRSGEQVL